MEEVVPTTKQFNLLKQYANTLELELEAKDTQRSSLYTRIDQLTFQIEQLQKQSQNHKKVEGNNDDFRQKYLQTKFQGQKFQIECKKNQMKIIELSELLQLKEKKIQQLQRNTTTQSSKDKNQLYKLKAEAEQYRKGMEAYKSEAERYKKQLDNNQTTNKNGQNELQILRKQKNMVDQQLYSLKNMNSTLSQELSNTKHERETFKEKCRSLQAQLIHLQTQTAKVEAFKNQINQYRLELDFKERETCSLKAIIGQLRKEIDNFEQECRALKQRIRNIEGNGNYLDQKKQSNNNQLNKTVSQLRLELKKMQGVNATIQAQNRQMQKIINEKINKKWNDYNQMPNRKHYLMAFSDKQSLKGGNGTVRPRSLLDRQFESQKNNIRQALNALCEKKLPQSQFQPHCHNSRKNKWDNLQKRIEELKIQNERLKISLFKSC